MQIAAGKFKAECLKLMDDVSKFHTEIIITKHGKPVAKLVPCANETEKPLFGYLKNSVELTGDIVQPIRDAWDADA